MPVTNETAEWHTSRSGKARIALGLVNGKFQVWALRTGTHELLPVTKNFVDEAKAREWANFVWKRF